MGLCDAWRCKSRLSEAMFEADASVDELSFCSWRIISASVSRTYSSRNETLYYRMSVFGHLSMRFDIIPVDMQVHRHGC